MLEFCTSQRNLSLCYPRFRVTVVEETICRLTDQAKYMKSFSISFSAFVPHAEMK